MLLTAAPERLVAEPADRFRHAWIDLVIFSLGWSFASLGLWAGAWRVFGEPFGRALPAVTVVMVSLLVPFRESLKAVTEIFFPRDDAIRPIAGSMVVLILTMSLYSLLPDYYYLTDAPLPAAIAWFRPWVKIYRILILSPLWGAWAMLITPQFIRVSDDTDPAIAAFAKGCSPLAAAAVMGVLLATTITYLNFLPWEQLGVSGATVVGAILTGLICSYRTGGLTRKALLATNLITQMIFVLAYLAARNMLV